MECFLRYTNVRVGVVETIASIREIAFTASSQSEARQKAQVEWNKLVSESSNSDETLKFVSLRTQVKWSPEGRVGESM